MSGKCLFCKIIEREVPAAILYQDEDVTVFKDNNPQAPVHILIIPNKHITSVNATSAEDQTVLGKLMLTASRTAEEQNVATSGYRLVANTGNNGGQTVYHLHIHLLGGRRMSWPPG